MTATPMAGTSTPMVTTVLGDIPVADLGHCQPHEHVYIGDTIAQATHPELCCSNFSATLAELALYRAAGGVSVVDAQPLGAGREARLLRDAAALTGVAIVASTGYHVPFFYPDGHWIFTASEERLTELFVEELEQGMYLGGSYDWPWLRTEVRAGVIKAMLTNIGVEGRSVVLLRAAARAAVRSGAPVLLHTERGVGAVAAVELLAGLGVAPERVMVCHLDRQTEDMGVHLAVAATGAYLEYDTITLFEHHDNAAEIRLIRRMIEAGYLERILLATDSTRDRLKSYGAAVGMDYILTSFIPLLRLSGFPEEWITAMCVDNPRRALQRIRQ